MGRALSRVLAVTLETAPRGRTTRSQRRVPVVGRPAHPLCGEGHISRTGASDRPLARIKIFPRGEYPYLYPYAGYEFRHRLRVRQQHTEAGLCDESPEYAKPGGGPERNSRVCHT